MSIGLELLKLLIRQKLLGKGLSGKPNTPLTVSFAVTKACNLRCRHCHVDAKDALGNELGLRESMRAIDEMRSLGTEVLIFSGGEPLLRKEFVKDLASCCVDVGIVPAMLTNGVLLNHQVACELKDSGIVALGIPIDSVEPEVHDNLRNVPGTFARALNAIRACVDVGIEVIITTMALKNTFEEMPRRIEFISRLGIDQVAVYDLVPAGRGKAIMDCAMTQEQRFSLIRYLQRQQEKGEMVFTMSGGQPLYPQIVSQMHESNGTKPRDLLLKQFWIHGRTGCHAGISYFSLRPNGDVYPCTFLPVKVGNIREQTITSIWQESRVFGELRERRLLKGKCGQCSYRESCGGCRGRAYAWGNSDYLESDPVCPEDLLSEERVFSGSIERFGWCVG